MSERVFASSVKVLYYWNLLELAYSLGEYWG